MIDRKPTTYYEVYPNNAAIDGLVDAPLIHRDTNKEDAIDEARKWGACVFRVVCHVITVDPMNREVVYALPIFVYRPRSSADPVHGMDRRALKRQLGLKRWTRPRRR